MRQGPGPSTIRYKKDKPLLIIRDDPARQRCSSLERPAVNASRFAIRRMLSKHVSRCRYPSGKGSSERPRRF